MRFETLKDLDVISDSDILFEYEVVWYMIQKEMGHNVVKDETYENYYKYMEDSRKEELKQEIYKMRKTQKIKMQRKKAKTEREKKQKEYLDKIKQIKEDRKNRDITKKIKALFWGEELLEEEIKIKRTFTTTTIITQNIDNITLYSNFMALNYIRRNNFFKFKIGQEFLCEIVEGNIAWISQDEETERVRYFSKNPETGKFFYLDIIDMIQLELGCSFLYAFIETMKLLKIKTEEEEYKKMNIRKYINNAEVTEKADIFFKIQYPNLYKLIGKKLFVLEKLNVIGMTNIRTQVESIENDAVFFSSYQHLADFLNIKSRTTVANAVNMFALLGLLDIVETDSIPYTFKERAEKEAKARGWKNLVTFFTIPLYTERVLKKAEEMAEKIIKNGITISNISIKRVEKAFGEEIVDRVYGNTKENTEKIMEIKDMKKQNMEQMIRSMEEEMEAMPF